MTQVTSQESQKVGNVAGEKMSLETTARKLVAGTGADVTWRGSSFQTSGTECRGQRRPEKLGRRQSTTAYDGRSVMMITLSEDNNF